MPKVSAKYQGSRISVWKEQLSEWIEAHPFQSLAVFTALCSAIAVGILQEIANRIIDTEIAPWLGATASVYRWIVIGVLLLFIAMGVIIWQQSLRLTRQQISSNADWPAVTHKRMMHAEGQLSLLGAHFKASTETIETIVRYLATPHSGEGDPEELQRLLIPIIVNRVRRMYARPHMVQHACIFTPSLEDPDYLSVYYMSDNNRSYSAQESRWYIGNDRKRQRAESGTAGTVFISRSSIVHHINPDTHKAEEGKDYIPSRTLGDVAMYVSFVAMPLLDGARCLGVLCLDSLERDTFDSDLNTILEPAAKLLVQALKLRQQVQETA